MGGPVLRETDSTMCTSYNTELLTTRSRFPASRIGVSVRNGTEQMPWARRPTSCRTLKVPLESSEMGPWHDASRAPYPMPRGRGGRGSHPLAMINFNPLIS